MSIYKRREYALELPDGKRVSPFQAPSPEKAATRAEILAKKQGLNGWKLYRDPEATYTVKIQFRGKAHVFETKLSVQRDAKSYEKRARQMLAAGRASELATFGLRAPVALQLPALLEHYKAFARDRGLAPMTINANMNAIQAVVRRVGRNPDAVTLEDLTAHMIYQFKQKVLDACEEEEPERAAQMKRTANSILRQAKSVLSAHAREYYREAQRLVLPDNLLGFVDAPGFTGTGKEDYRIPSDQLIQATFTALEELQEKNRNAYLAIWLALGFGLRRSEIAAVRVGWFQRVNGQVKLELRSTIVAGTVDEKPTTKNGSMFPQIDPSNGGWEKIQPLLQGLSPGDYVLQCKTASDRCDILFRDIADWMKKLGWQTEKSIHEFRAYAGCRVAMRDGIEAASKWLRHSSIVVTQKHYGRYLRPTVTNQPI